jgi:alpha-beta hydrolase superfamily lysophospholipase
MGAGFRFALSRSGVALYFGMLGCILGCGTPSAPESAAKSEIIPQAEHEVTFIGAQGVKLAGTLLIPVHEQGTQIAGVIIVAGSGPTDRNGNQPGLTIDLLKQIAEHLAQEGIASLRCDKRGQYASGKPKDGEALSGFTVWQNYVGDVAAALAYLQKQPEIDADRTAMVGHSEGGLLVIQAAVEGEGFRKPPAALVLVSTPGRRCDLVLRDQIARRLRQQKATAQQTKFFLTKNDEIMAAIKKTGQTPQKVPPGLAALYPPYLGKFLQSLLDFEAAAWASRIPAPVLVLAGEKDSQHVVDQETSALSAGLMKRQHDDHERYIVPGASHNLKPVKADNDLGFAGDMAPEAAAKLRSWLGKNLGSIGKN